MEKNSKRSAKLIVVLIALLLIACSLLGFTLARYITEEREGQGGVNIAQWDIDVDDATTEGAGTVTAMLSPAMDEYNNTEHATNGRTHTVAAEGSRGLVITNNSDVDATVTLTITNGLTFYSNTANEDGGYDAVTDNDTPTYNAETQENAQWNNVDLIDIIHPDLGEGENASDYDSFRVKVYKADGSEDNTPYADQDQVATTVTYEITLDANGGYLEVLIGEITWTTDLQGETWSDEDNGVMPGDLRDTWIGENVGSVGFAYSWIAEQASQVPDGGVSEPTP